MPWTVDNPPPPAENWGPDEIEKCVKAANKVLKDTGDEAKAIYACIHAAGRTKEEKFETSDDPIEISDEYHILDKDKRRAYRNFRKWLKDYKRGKFQGILDAEEEEVE